MSLKFKDGSVFRFRVTQSKKMLYADDEGTTILRNVGN